MTQGACGPKPTATSVPVASSGPTGRYDGIVEAPTSTPEELICVRLVARLGARGDEETGDVRVRPERQLHRLDSLRLDFVLSGER